MSHSHQRNVQRTVAICVSAILVGGLLWKTSKEHTAGKAVGRTLVFYGVNRILPVLLS
jgi:hypothetical protein